MYPGIVSVYWTRVCSVAFHESLLFSKLVEFLAPELRHENFSEYCFVMFHLYKSSYTVNKLNLCYYTNQRGTCRESQNWIIQNTISLVIIMWLYLHHKDYNLHQRDCIFQCFFIYKGFLVVSFIKSKSRFTLEIGFQWCLTKRIKLIALLYQNHVNVLHIGDWWWFL